MQELNYIKEQVEEKMEINISSKSKDTHSAISRWLYYKLARKLTDYSLSTIGNLVNRDHSTVLYGLRKVDDEMKFNAKYAAAYEQLSLSCKARLSYNSIEAIDRAIDELNREIKKLELIKAKREETTAQ